MTDLTETERPDPDQLLAGLQREAARPRGRLRVFLGYAPGVGKTWRMLDAACALLQERQDVVVGVALTHGRADTAKLLALLPALPLREVTHRGQRLQEFDLDGALARKPAVLLVDELAHTNAPGSRHPKRWQDVRELCQAGIEVWTTLNIQHVESVADTVAQIVGSEVRETVPDLLLDEATTVEIIDITPEALLQRLADGKVYAPDQAVRARQHFFQLGHLMALRELALRRTAARVDVDVQTWRHQQRGHGQWAATERIVVCVGPAPSSAGVLRAAARLAAELHGTLLAVWVDGPPPGLLGSDRDRLESHLQLAEALGASVTRLAATDPALAIAAFAQRHGASRLVLGKPQRRPWYARWRTTLADQILAHAGTIDVHMLGGSTDGAPHAGQTDAAVADSGPRWRYFAASWLVVSALGVALGLQRLLGVPDPEMLFLLAIMAAAAWYGRGPGLLASALSVLAYDFWFVPPFYTFTVDDQRYLLTFVLMFLVGLLLSGLADRLRAEQREAVAREARTAALFALSRDLGAAQTQSEVADVAVRHAVALLGFPARLAVVDGGTPLSWLAPPAANEALSDKVLAVAQWTVEHAQAAGSGTTTLSDAGCHCVPLCAADRVLGVLLLQTPPPIRPWADRRLLAEQVARQVAGALERLRLQAVAQAAQVTAKTEQLRSALLSSVSHDLRTPLAALTGVTSLLRSQPDLDPAVRDELLGDVHQEAGRLERLVSNLLDMTRLEAGVVQPQREWLPADEVVGAALTLLEQRLADRALHLAIAPDLPLLWVDPVLMQQLLVNLLDNACKYAPAQSPLWLSVARAHGGVALRLRDAGPGFDAADLPHVFERFWRGRRSGVAGSGLGLAIAHALAVVHGGTLEAANHPDGGAVLTLWLPVPAAGWTEQRKQP